MDGTLYSGGGGVAKLLRRWRNYNQVAFFGGLLALAGAASLWSLMYFGGQFATLGILSAIYGHESELPREYPFWFAGVCVFLVLLHFVLGEVFPPPSSYDRPILGWHLLPQVLTLPVGLTMAIYQQ
ncbi:MAG: hypothetical protein NZL93_04990, partial [Chthoniobacterales bacterium]|nr:hypothetical protein [Chthoniobacterales bacterium]